MPSSSKEKRHPFMEEIKESVENNPLLYNGTLWPDYGNLWRSLSEGKDQAAVNAAIDEPQNLWTVGGAIGTDLKDAAVNTAIGALISGGISAGANRLMKSPAFKNALRKIPMPKKWQDRLTASAVSDSIDDLHFPEDVSKKIQKLNVEGKYDAVDKLTKKEFKKEAVANKRINSIAKEVLPPDESVTKRYRETASQLGIQDPEKYIKPQKDLPLTKQVLEEHGYIKPEPHVLTEPNLLDGLVERGKPDNFDDIVKSVAQSGNGSRSKVGVSLFGSTPEDLRAQEGFFKIMSQDALEKANKKAEKKAAETAKKVEKQLGKGKLAFDEGININDPVYQVYPKNQKYTNVDIPEIDSKKAAKVGAGVGAGGSFIKSIFDALAYGPQRRTAKYAFTTDGDVADRAKKSYSYYNYDQSKVDPVDLTNGLVRKLESMDYNSLSPEQQESWTKIAEMMENAETYQDIAQWIYSSEGQNLIKSLRPTNNKEDK